MATITTLAGNEFAPELPGRLLRIVRDIREAGGRAFLVGGWVRDALLGKNCRDYDIEVYDMTQDALVPILKNYGRTNLVGKAFGVIHLAMKGESLDFSFPRTESKVGYGHRGFVVHTDEKLSFKEAALRRDFTINAMGMELPDLTLCDPYGGIGDLKAHVLRHVGPAFAEDSLRILRGVQFASRFECTLAPETVELCRTLSLADLSVERLFEEFKKWLLKPGRPSMGLRAFLDIGLEGFFPEVVSLAGSWEALGRLLDNMADARASVGGEPPALGDDESSELAFAALLSGNAIAVGAGGVKPVAEKFLARITNEIHLLKKVPELLSCYGGLDFEKVPSAPELRRLAVRLGGLKLLCLLVQSTPALVAGNPGFAAALRDAAREIGVYDAAPQPYLTGKMLLDMGMKPGKQMGDIIKRSFELQLDGEIKNISDALAWAKEINLSLSV
jgi:tRNA nucleotidyltransferase (CCA-adding enzyme)